MKTYRLFTTLRLFMAVALMLAISCGGERTDPNAQPTPEQPTTNPGPVAQNRDTDDSTAPGSDQQDPPGARGAVSVRLQTNAVRTRHVMQSAITAGKLAYVAATITVAMGAATGSSAADPTLVGGVLLACTAAGNNDQFVDNAVLNGDGSITVTLGANGTAANQIRCVALKPNAFGAN